ncbi:hypothetical protein [Methylobacterium iners]|uniref:Uncharacterized protein n=1 Tax=Methylobacterium iners TaxID=418707 RepID=A0ABQ4RR92_9HYPH|nr:hypothetical protein [Methylobacterium iners]GJD93296.1 hypothetical protein OCOJLMKI_0487 [Methylobacterium iners]
MHTYKVTVRTPSGELSVRRDTIEDAVETALVLQKEGLGQITITPPGGPAMELAALAVTPPEGGNEANWA